MQFKNAYLKCILCIVYLIGYWLCNDYGCIMLHNMPKIQWKTLLIWRDILERQTEGGGGAHSHHAPSRLWICFIMRNKPFLAITLLQSSKALAGRLLPCLSLFERSLTTVTMRKEPQIPSLWELTHCLGLMEW